MSVDQTAQSDPREQEPALERKESQVSRDSQTASDFINTQLQLEADAREILPYSFDSCTYSLGPLKQGVFACLTCNPSPASPAQLYSPAGVCYSCSISCHGEHTLVELFNRRNFTCDCGTTRFASTPCTLRADPTTGAKGVSGQTPAQSNTYNHNFKNKFCGCGEYYDAHQEKGTMFQCVGLGTVETGGCGEDWWHPECIMGLSRDWNKSAQADVKKPEMDEVAPSDAADEASEDAPVPPGFPTENDFDAFICYKCVESNPWIKSYAGTTGFLPPIPKKSSAEMTSVTESHSQVDGSRKRKASEEPAIDRASSPSKKFKDEEAKPNGEITADQNPGAVPKHKHDSLPPAPTGIFSLFLKEDFREHFCHCPACFPNLVPHPQLVEEEETYEPPLSESGNGDVGPGSGARSQGTGSLLERGEAALSTMDRVKAIEGVMVYNHLKDKVKEFLKPYAESGKAVGAEDIKAYFEKLRGDESAIKEASGRPKAGDESDEGNDGDSRREQSGY